MKNAFPEIEVGAPIYNINCFATDSFMSMHEFTLSKYF